MDALTFSQMLCSRLCHDLITPIGAISSGFEILEACEEAERKNLTDLTRRSAETALQRLTFYRAAFGYSFAAQHSSLLSIKQLMENFLRPLKIYLDWPSIDACAHNEELSAHLASWGRLFLNLILVGAEGMPYGGEIQILTSAHSQECTLHFKGDLVAVRPEIMTALKGQSQPDDYTPQTIQAISTKMLAEQLQADLLPHQINTQEFHLQVLPLTNS